MLDNGVHSLGAGIDAFRSYVHPGQEYLLKDAVMSLHHGIELLLKEMLFRENPYLIYEDLRDAAKKQKEADKKGIGIFQLERPPKTVSYEDALDRVDAFIRPVLLTDTLKSQLIELNRVRNSLEHYELDVEADKLEQLLKILIDPLLSLFRTGLQDLHMRGPNAPDGASVTISDRENEFSRLVKEVENAMTAFNGQTVPGSIFGIEGNIVLPRFTSIRRDKSRFVGIGSEFGYCLVAESPKGEWIVEIQKHPTAHATKLLMHLSHVATERQECVWLVLFHARDANYSFAPRAEGVYVTLGSDWPKLKALLDGETRGNH